jgi:hypothetical protein
LRAIRRLRRCYGKRRYVTLGTDGWNRQRAEAELRHVLADVERGLWRPHEPEPVEAPAQVPTFHQFASKWLAARAVELAREWYPTAITAVTTGCPDAEATVLVEVDGGIGVVHYTDLDRGGPRCEFCGPAAVGGENL